MRSIVAGKGFGRRFLMRPVEACIESHGGQFEYILQLQPFRYNSQHKLNFSGHMFYTHIFLFWHVELASKLCPHLPATHCTMKTFAGSIISV